MRTVVTGPTLLHCSYRALRRFTSEVRLCCTLRVNGGTNQNPRADYRMGLSPNPHVPRNSQNGGRKVSLLNFGQMFWDHKNNRTTFAKAPNEWTQIKHYVWSSSGLITVVLITLLGISGLTFVCELSGDLVWPKVEIWQRNRLFLVVGRWLIAWVLID